MPSTQSPDRKLSFRISRDLSKKFLETCKAHGVVGAKLKRNWALNFMATNDPTGHDRKFKVLKVEVGDLFMDQVYFPSAEEKNKFVEFCEKQSISASDFFRTCLYNFVMTGDPTGYSDDKE